MKKDKKPNIVIDISGNCSTQKYELAKEIGQYLKDKCGFGQVNLLSDGDVSYAYDGFSSEESVLIKFQDGKHKEDLQRSKNEE
jgi:hypothetical protein